MTYLAVRSAVRAAVSTAAGLVLEAVIWGAASATAADPQVRLEVISDRETAPVRDTLATSGLDLAYTQSQQREIVIQVRAESVSDLTVDDALAVAETTRMRLQALTSRDSLGFVLVDVSGLRPHAYRVDGRLVQAWSFDLRIRAKFTQTYITPVGTIESVGVSGTTAVPTIEIPEEYIP